jgi:hypothetical protein
MRLLSAFKLVLLWIMLYATPVYAIDQPIVLVTDKDDVTYIDCDKEKLSEVTSKFSDVRDKAVNLAVSDCKARVNSTGDVKQIDEAKMLAERKFFTAFVKEQIKDDLGEFDGFNNFMTTWGDIIEKGDKATFLVNNVFGAGTIFELEPGKVPDDSNRVLIALKPENRCTAIEYDGAGFDSCAEVAGELQKAIEVASAFRLSEQLTLVETYYKQLNGQWQTFVDDARFQTTWDVLLTTWMYSDKWKAAELQGPPPIQYFVLHPTLTYSYMPDASRGEELKPVPAIEWFGMNWWRNKVPLGLSVTSVYNDRPDGKAFLHGLTLHVYNAYSFGMVGTGDERTFFVNLDLMNWFSDKQAKRDKYKNQFDEYRKNLEASFTF